MGDVAPDVIPCGRFEWERRIRDDETMEIKLKGVALIFATHAQLETGGQIFPGNAALARRCSMSLPTFKRWRDELISRGLITKVQQGNRHKQMSDEWALTIPSAPTAEPRESHVTSRDVSRVTEEVSHSHDSDDDGALPTPYERARRMVERELAGLVKGSVAYDAARGELVHDLQHRVTATEARELLGLSEIEYKSALRRRWPA